MGIPKIIHKGKNTYEFERKIKDNMYLYREKECGYTTTFCNHDLGIVQRVPRAIEPRTKGAM